MINRDTAVKNKPVLKTAAEFLTLRTSVPTAQMHVQALYDFMNLSIPGTLGCTYVHCRVCYWVDP